jgi:hypothetical protein
MPSTPTAAVEKHTLPTRRKQRAAALFGLRMIGRGWSGQANEENAAMSEAGAKLLNAAREAVQVATCDHRLELIARQEKADGTVYTAHCLKCRARFTTHRLSELTRL